MRVLPDNPHPNFLRQEAKDLLVALRESDSGASLTDAQRVLAGEYGFDGWPALKVEVEARRHRPPSPPAGLAEGLADAFDLGPVTIMEPVTYSPLGRQWSLTTAQGRWLALPGYPWMNDDDHAETGERLRLAVSADEVPSPAFRRSGAGRLIESVAGDPWRVAAWQDLGPVPSLPARAAVARRAGEIAGALHSLAIPSDEPIHPYLTWRHSADDWQELLRRARTAGRPWADRLAALLPVVAELGALGAAVPTEGLLLCNCNLLPENVRQGPGEELVVVDWAFTGSLTAEYEVASLLTHWGLRPELNRVAAKAFATGYAERAGSFPELSRDSFGLAITSHLNWTYNAFCEAISPADPDAADHAEREVADLLPRPWTPALLDQVISAAIP